MIHNEFNFGPFYCLFSLFVFSTLAFYRQWLFFCQECPLDQHGCPSGAAVAWGGCPEITLAWDAELTEFIFLLKAFQIFTFPMKVFSPTFESMLCISPLHRLIQQQFKKSSQVGKFDLWVKDKHICFSSLWLGLALQLRHRAYVLHQRILSGSEDALPFPVHTTLTCCRAKL